MNRRRVPTRMASDEELARRVARVEDGAAARAAAAPTAREELEEYRAVAGEIHDELARRIAAVDDSKLDEEALSDVIERLDRLEARI